VEVAGEVIRGTLPATGSDDQSLSMIDGALVLIGLVSMVARREVSS
jgi:LPXTG-motif cell wall-anchored protein